MSPHVGACSTLLIYRFRENKTNFGGACVQPGKKNGGRIFGWDVKRPLKDEFASTMLHKMSVFLAFNIISDFF